MISPLALRRTALPLVLALAAAGCATGSTTNAAGPVSTSSTSAPVAVTSTGIPAAPGQASSAPAPATPAASPAASTPVDCHKLKCVALTYDDGPSPYTPELLKTFTSRHANTTLFMLGNAAATYPETVKQAHAEGFEIANHTWDHKAISGLGDAQVLDEVTRTNAELKKLTGVEPTVMRPPYAARTKRTDAVVGKAGLAVVVWNNSPEDWVAGHDTAEISTKLTLQRTSRNSIILMHDIHPWTVKAAPAIIDALHKQGYTLVTVSQLLGSTTPGTLYPKA